MTTYAIADLHGRHDLLMDALYAIRDDDFDKGKPGGTIITLGDYVDRGPDSKKIIETLMAGLAPVFGEDSGFELVCLKGNHEAMMLQVCSTGGLIDWWLGNGGGQRPLRPPHKRSLERRETPKNEGHLMQKFAKLFDVGERQLIVYVEFDQDYEGNDEKFTLHQITDVGGAMLDIAMGGSEAAMRAIFDAYDQGVSENFFRLEMVTKVTDAFAEEAA